jgi:hypothetical protein
MDLISLFNETTGFIDGLKPSVLEALGPIASVVKLGTQIFFGAVILLALYFGRSRWDPPTPRIPTLPTRGLAIIVAFGLSLIYFASGTTDNVNLWPWSWGLFVVGLVLTVGVYYPLNSNLCFDCEGDPTVYVKGFWLHKQARFMMRGEMEKLEGPYKPADEAVQRTRTTKEYFCQTDKRGDFVWRDWSVIICRVVLVVTYWAAVTPLVLSLAAAATSLSQPCPGKTPSQPRGRKPFTI